MAVLPTVVHDGFNRSDGSGSSDARAGDGRASGLALSLVQNFVRRTTEYDEGMATRVAIGPDRVRRIADFRAALRAFERRTEQNARRCGLTPQRYLVLLMIEGASGGGADLTFTQLTERLQLGRNTVTELVARCETAGLVRRARSNTDRRTVHLSLTGEGRRRLRCALRGNDESRRELAKSFTQLRTTFRDASTG